MSITDALALHAMANELARLSQGLRATVPHEALPPTTVLRAVGRFTADVADEIEARSLADPPPNAAGRDALTALLGVPQPLARAAIRLGQAQRRLTQLALSAPEAALAHRPGPAHRTGLVLAAEHLDSAAERLRQAAAALAPPSVNLRRTAARHRTPALQPSPAPSRPDVTAGNTSARRR